ncbi:MAG: hypothetical protein LBL90_14220 [Prevotellaceae bacterium]|nr:hypothetical protein [Prevotellaceae bacterium]
MKNSLLHLTNFNCSKRILQTYRDNGTLAYTQIKHKIFYKPEDEEIAINKYDGVLQTMLT